MTPTIYLLVKARAPTREDAVQTVLGPMVARPATQDISLIGAPIETRSGLPFVGPMSERRRRSRPEPCAMSH